MTPGKIPQVVTVKSLFNPSRYPALQHVLAEGGSQETSLVDDVYDRILLQIVRGELAEDTELKSTRLAEELHVSRTPVVQALARLTADGIVAQQRHRRAAVRSTARDWLVHVHQLRQLRKRMCRHSFRLQPSGPKGR